MHEKRLVRQNTKLGRENTIADAIKRKHINAAKLVDQYFQTIESPHAATLDLKSINLYAI